MCVYVCVYLHVCMSVKVTLDTTSARAFMRRLCEYIWVCMSVCVCDLSRLSTILHEEAVCV